jgi:hypothetical protein
MLFLINVDWRLMKHESMPSNHTNTDNMKAKRLLVILTVIAIVPCAVKIFV